MLLIFPEAKSWSIGFNLGLGYLASILEKKGRHPRIIDCQGAEDYEQDIRKALKEYAWIGIHVNVATVTHALNIAQMVRKLSPGAKIVMGGPHATVIYDRLIPEYADIVVRGEGEHTIGELIADSKPLRQIPGIAYWDDGLKVNPPRVLIEDLDGLPFPARHLVNLNKIGRLITTRGCPYQCIFCACFIIHGRKPRSRSIDNIMSEIDYLVSRFSMQEILIHDDCFNYDLERVKNICKAIIKLGHRSLRFSALDMRADVCDAEMFKLMKRAGFYFVRFGIESGSQEVLNKTNKNLELSKVKQTIILARKAGLRVGGYFMLGLPFDTIETMQKTIDFAKTLSLDRVSMGIATPFPGTKFYDMVRQNGKFLRDPFLQSITKTIGHEYGDLRAEDAWGMFMKANRQFSKP